MTEPETDAAVVRRTAELADLEITPEEAARLGPQFARILGAFQRLTELDVEGVAEMVRGRAIVPRTRADEPRPSLPRDAALAGAPARRGEFYGVPKTLGGES